MPPDPHHDRRWLILAVIAIAQLLVVLDATIVNIALPSAQRDLGFSDDQRQWVVTAYALAFGSLLLLGGRIADLFGRKWTFVAGLIGFAGASAVGGAAQSFSVLVAARAVQGTFAAILAPAALSLLTTTFTDPAERGKAFGVYGAIAGTGGAFGLLLGGTLTEVLDWRWCLYVATRLRRSRRPRRRAPAAPRPRAGASPARPRGHVDRVLRPVRHRLRPLPRRDRRLGRARDDRLPRRRRVLLLTFLALQRRVRIRCCRSPWSPTATAARRSWPCHGGRRDLRVFLFLTFYFQRTKGMSAVRDRPGVPAAERGDHRGRDGRQHARARPHRAAAADPAGMLSAAVGMALLTRIGTDTGYASHVLPSLVLIGLGFGTIVAAAFATATLGVAARDSGVVSAMVSTSQQVGGSIGAALLSTMAASAVTGYLTGHGPGSEAVRRAAVEGDVTAFRWAAAIFAVGALVTAGLLRSRVRPVAVHEAPEAMAAQAQAA